LANNPDKEQVILDHFCNFVAKNDFSFLRFNGEFRLAKSEDRETIVARCEVTNLDKFTASLSGTLGIEIPPQPTHVTLYTLQPDLGIGLNSSVEIETKSAVIEVPEEIRAAIMACN
jgi:hypothetical protein